MEPLESRSCPSIIYRLDLMATAGDLDMIGMGDGPSINDAGKVAFVGQYSDGEGLIVADGDASLRRLKNIDPSWSHNSARKLGRVATINNLNQVLAVDREARSEYVDYVLRLWDATKLDSKTDLVNAGTPKNGSDQYDTLSVYADLGNDGYSYVYVGYDSDMGLWHLEGYPGEVAVLGGNQILRPQMSSGAPLVVARIGEHTDNSDPILQIGDNGLTQIVIASTAQGFIEKGNAPGTSNNGDITAFYGDLKAHSAVLPDDGGGPGIFARVVPPGQSDEHGNYVRIAGLTNNGVLDPGETGDDNGNGVLDAGEIDRGPFDAFDPRTRVAVNDNTVVFMASDTDGHKVLYSARIEVENPEDTSHPQILRATDLTEIASVGKTIKLSNGQETTIEDISINDPLNAKGQVVFWAKGDGGTQEIIRATPLRRPVLFVPGIIGTLPSNANYTDWLLNRGYDPEKLLLEPIAHSYDNLMATLQKDGYTLGKDLFAAAYDWRVDVAPRPAAGQYDGIIDVGTSGDRLTDNTFEYGVDYLGYWLKQAVTAWKTANPGIALDSVDIIAHSTGGLVARAYIQSTAYGATFGAGDHLPKVNNLIMVGVPNRGASKAWNILHNDWGIDPIFRNVISAILYGAANKLSPFTALLNNYKITNPDGSVIRTSDVYLRDSRGTYLRDESGKYLLDYKKFLDLYTPTIQTLLATYPFLSTASDGFEPVTVNDDDAYANRVLLDLNGGESESALTGFVSKLTQPISSNPVTVIAGTAESTPTLVYGFPGPTESPELISEFDSITDRGARDGETYYQDQLLATPGGDGTVPIISSAAPFLDTPGFLVKQYRRGVNTQANLDHQSLLSNPEILRSILHVLKQDHPGGDDVAAVSNTDYLLAVNHLVLTHLSLRVDPVDAYLSDDSGRRLGFTAATGPLAELPGSVYIGDSNGFGLMAADAAPPTTLTVVGTGGPYSVQVSGAYLGRSWGLSDQGTLAAGETKTTPLDFRPPDRVPPRVKALTVLDRPSADRLRIAVDFDMAMKPGPAANPANYVVSSPGSDGLVVLGVTYADSGSQHRAILTVAIAGAESDTYQVQLNGRQLSSVDGTTMGDASDQLYLYNGPTASLAQIGKRPDGVGLLAPPDDISGAGHVRQLWTADLDGDGILDLIAVGSRVLVQFGQADGGHSDPRTVLPFDAPTGAGYPVDWNGDGNVDIAIVAYTEVVVFLNDGHAHFSMAPDMPVPLPDDLSGRIGAFADFNGDGQMDIVVGAYHRAFYGYGGEDGIVDDGRVILITKDPYVGYTVTATLQHKPPGVEEEQFPQQLITADFNGDGRPDLAIANSGFYYLNDHTIVTLMNSASGLQPAVLTPATNYNVARIAVADFTGDGKLDIVAVHERYRNSYDEQIGIVAEILEGDGRGQFTVHPYQPLNTRDATLLAATEMNGDGSVDLVFSLGSSTWTWLNDGHGTFLPATTDSVELDPLDAASIGSAVVVDFNHDGRADLYVTGGAVAQARALRNTGIGVLLSEHEADAVLPRWAPGGTYDRATSAPLIVADFNKDGFPDFLTIDAGNGPLAALVRLGDATGHAAEYRATSLFGMSFSGVIGETADINKDGNLDVVVLSGAGGLALLGRGDGTFALAPAFTSSGGIDNAHLADVNGDGKLDIVSGIGALTALIVDFGDGTGKFTENLNTKLTLSYGTAYGSTLDSFVVADFDGDGKPDVVQGRTDGNLQFFKGLGTGRFSSTPTITDGIPPVTGLTAADFDGDGKLDIAAVFRDPTNSIYDWGSAAYVFFGDGNGAFGRTSVITTLSYPLGLTVADFDGNGSLDVAVTETGWVTTPRSPTLALNDGHGTFTTSALPTGTWSTAAATWKTPTLLDAGTVTLNTVSFEASTTFVNERDAQVRLLVTRRGDLSGTLTVHYATADGTATAGADYRAVHADITFDPGETFKTITIAIVNDAANEPDETFTVTLQPGADGVAGANASTTVMIVNDDARSPGRAFRLVADTTTISEASPRSIQVRVDRLDGSLGTVSVAYRMVDGTATGGHDYNGGSGVLTFTEGVTQQFITLTAYDDPDVEASETFDLVLSDPQGGPTIEAPERLTFTIASDDVGSAPAGTFVMTAEGGSLLDEVSRRVIQVRVDRVGGSAGSVSVAYRTLDRTATSGVDYAAASGVLTFAAGETQQFVTLTAYDDTTAELDETFDLILSNPTGGSLIGSPSWLTFTIVSNEVLTTDNHPPTLAPIAEVSIYEGQPFTMIAAASDPDAGSALTYSLDSAPAGMTIDPVSGIITWTPLDGPFTSTATVRVKDNGVPALQDAQTFAVTVLNVAPTVVAGADVSLNVGEALSRLGFFADPGNDLVSATIDYGDGTGGRPLALSPLKTFRLDHEYASAGTYTVTVTMTDEDHATGVGRFLVHVGGQASAPVSLLPVFVTTGGTTKKPSVQHITLRASGSVSILPGAIELFSRQGKKLKPVKFTTAATIDNGQTIVTLSLPGKRSLANGKYLLIVHADKIRDRLGRPLDGNGDGIAGGDWSRPFQVARGKAR